MSGSTLTTPAWRTSREPLVKMPPLTGIKVVELGVMIAVPGATAILAGLGAMTEEGERLTALLDNSRGDRGEHQRELDALILRIGALGREVTRLETVATERRVEHAGRAERCDRLRRAHERSIAAWIWPFNWPINYSIYSRTKNMADSFSHRMITKN